MLKCAEWCGRGCTEEEFQTATALATALVRELNATTSIEWVPKVTENLGWHYGAVSKCDRISVSTGYGTQIYKGASALMSPPGEGPGGIWAEHGDTPAEAVERVISAAKLDFARYAAAVKGL